MFSGFVAFVMLLNTYMTSPWIKFRGKIYAYHVSDCLPDPSPDGAPAPGSEDPDYDPAPDSYDGSATAQKTWWSHVFAMALCVFCVIVRSDDRPWLTPVAMAILVLVPVFFGFFADGSWGYPIARGQYLQFGIIGLITAGVFPVLYLAGYYAGRRWPVRRKQAMEYRVHPRHQKKWPQ